MRSHDIRSGKLRLSFYVKTPYAGIIRIRYKGSEKILRLSFLSTPVDSLTVSFPTLYGPSGMLVKREFRTRNSLYF